MEYILSIFLTLLTVALDLLVNREFQKNDIICCIIDAPSEIISLSMGFVITYAATATDNEHAVTGIVLVLASFLLSLIIYAIRHHSSKFYISLANTTSNRSIKELFHFIFEITFSLGISVLFCCNSIIFCMGGKTL